MYYKVPQELQSRFQDEAWDAVTFGMSATSFAELEDASQEIIPLRLLSVFSGTPLHLFALAAFFQFGFGHFFSDAALVPASAAQAAADAGSQDSASWSLDSFAVQSFSEVT